MKTQDENKVDCLKKFRQICEILCTIQNSKIFARQERQLKQTPVQSKKKISHQ